MQGTPIGFLALAPVTTIPVAGGGRNAIPDAQRLEIPAGFTTVELHVTLVGGSTGNYGVLRYWPQDDEWRLERGLSSFGHVAAASACDPISIPVDRAMSLAVYSDGSFDGESELAVLSCTVR